MGIHWLFCKMPQITRALLRKRSEHNEGIISSLEELTLHQEELEGINEVLGATCRHLKILYLQNNLIQKLENLTHLKELEYLNLALNNVSKIEGLQNCEHIKKLDFTANFIDVDELEESMNHLAERDRLRDMYMMGNPCQANWPSFVNYVIAKLPQLQTLDGTEITKSMQIQARQQLPKMEAELRQLAIECRLQKEQKRMQRELAKSSIMITDEEDDCDENIKGEKMTENTPEARQEIYMEIAQQKKEKEERENVNKPKERNYSAEQSASVAQVREVEGSLSEKDIKQKNEAGYLFHWNEEASNDYIELHIELPKHLDSSLVDVDVHPTYASIIIKSKLLRLRLPCEVKSSESHCSRSKLTGELVIKMPKLNAKETSIFVTQKKTVGDNGSKRANPRTVINTTDKSIKMPSQYGDNDLLNAKVTTVFDAVDGAFDVSPVISATKARTVIKKPKALSIQEQLLLEATNALQIT